jgi:hypothetical protein
MSKSELKKAEQEVERSTHQFERAMDHLEEKVGTTARRVLTVVRAVRSPMERIRAIPSQARALPMRMRDNPRSLFISSLVLGLSGVFVTLYFARREAIRSRYARRRSRSRLGLRGRKARRVDLVIQRRPRRGQVRIAA